MNTLRANDLVDAMVYLYEECADPDGWKGAAQKLLEHLASGGVEPNWQGREWLRPMFNEYANDAPTIQQFPAAIEIEVTDFV